MSDNIKSEILGQPNKPSMKPLLKKAHKEKTVYYKPWTEWIPLTTREAIDKHQYQGRNPPNTFTIRDLRPKQTGRALGLAVNDVIKP